ncbi:hypothetical protein, partial [Butyrivibrio sp. AE3009]|uniref:hypothetical protein n=1 Tax=Butyrivibrio sp. AE3009 TaxID=1280666 RepID=UPI00056CF94E
KCILEASFMSGSYAACRVRGVKDGVYSHSTLYRDFFWRKDHFEGRRVFSILKQEYMYNKSSKIATND